MTHRNVLVFDCLHCQCHQKLIGRRPGCVLHFCSSEVCGQPDLQLNICGGSQGLSLSMITGVRTTEFTLIGTPLDIIGIEPALKEELDAVTCVSQRLPQLLQVGVMKLSLITKVRSVETPNSWLWQCLVHNLNVLHHAE